MRVVPASAVEISGESISEVISRSNRTLLNARNAVVVRGVFLKEAVPVKRGTFLVDWNAVLVGGGYRVMYSDGDSVSPVSFDERPRELVVDQQHGAVDAIRAQDSTRDGEIVRSCHAGTGRNLWISIASCCIAPRSRVTTIEPLGQAWEA